MKVPPGCYDDFKRYPPKWVEVIIGPARRDLRNNNGSPYTTERKRKSNERIKR